jgi:hypothetical protein
MSIIAIIFPIGIMSGGIAAVAGFGIGSLLTPVLAHQIFVHRIAHPHRSMGYHPFSNGWSVPWDDRWPTRPQADSRAVLLSDRRGHSRDAWDLDADHESAVVNNRLWRVRR